MRLYIDKENLVSLMSSKDRDSFEECARVIRRDLDVKYNFTKEEIRSNETLMAWFMRFGQGVTGNIEYNNNNQDTFPPRPLKSNFYNNDRDDSLYSIYLLNDAHICDVVNQKGSVLIGKVGEETKILSSLFLDDTETPASEIPSWQDYCPLMPLTDIIICDNHYFKNKYTYEKNDNELIVSLLRIPQNSPVNVVIITKEREVDPGIDLQQMQKEIKDVVKKMTGSSKSSVTILTTYSTHDRNLITNYFRIKHGSCFHLKDNGLKPDVTTEIKTHIIRKNEVVTKRLLGVFQRIANSPVQCIGDRKSNFLKFS